ncbi:MAG: phenylalanine--tRNA ligase subunit beta [Bacteroidetes bacterium]|nr:phenylalanine--tRNA ligase subunit beta [Bacteroidota bacterium]
MKVSHRWLQSFVQFRFTPQQFVEKLSMLGLEVESYEDQAQKFDKFVVGEVLETTKHPHADRLTLCKVAVGTEVLDIVCGAPNVAKGQKVPVALVGAVVPRNQHSENGTPLTIERVKIRGVESNGMICSEYELGIGDNRSGILVLDQRAKVGTPLAHYLRRTDIIYDIGITPNRGDCLSHIGIAREISALVQKHLKLPTISITESTASVKKFTTVTVEDVQRCPRYCARVVRNVTLGPSPQWMQDRLVALGIRPINNIVDITNYVLLETGHPLHAFDYDKLAGHRIVVRTATEGEKFVTLDGKERVLTADTLIICDAERPIAIAGVMGGANTEISETTRNVLIESAYFDPSCIRRTSKHLGLSTEASYRFERNADIEMTVYALNRAAQLIQEIAGGEVLRGMIDVYPKKRKPHTVRVRVQRVNDCIGTSLSKSEISSLLKRLHFTVQSRTSQELSVTVPSYRNDIREEIDIIEEVARLYGYNNVPTERYSSIDFTATTRNDVFEDELRNYLCGAGFNEILTISLQDEATARLAGGEPIRVLNAVSAGMEVLRTSLIPGALKVVVHNQNHGTLDVRLFEIGTVFSKRSGGSPTDLASYHEEQHLLLVLGGAVAPLAYGVQHRKVDFFDIKGEVEALLRKFNLDKYRFIYYDTHSPLLSPCIGVEIGGTRAGLFGKVRREVATALGIDEPVFVCELVVDVLHRYWGVEKKFTPLPKFPNVYRDVAIVVDQSVPHAVVEEGIRSAGTPLLQAIMLFDVYTGEQVGPGKKSLAYSLEFRSLDHTLTDAEVDDAVETILRAVHQKCGGVLRR